ncbi:hypothetical protein COC69_17175 [Bacillus cereus]|uniref:Transposase n=1 Tax=Bacillus cereus TaxID=1396 RepID=A0A9X7CM70_BACCE|nr:hypothetical protein COC69_17175 [Bacillus cereus]
MYQVLHVSRSGYYKWEKSHQKSQASTKRTTNERNTMCFPRITLFIWKPEGNVCLTPKRKAHLIKTVARIMKEQG